MHSLSVISCNRCGACCTVVGTPPGFFAAYCSLQWDGKFLADEEDYAIWLAMPEHLRQELAAYYDQACSEGGLDRANEGLPCLWYDETSRCCRNYESRPSICREFEVGSEDCLEARKREGVI